MNVKHEKAQVRIEVETFNRALHEVGLPDMITMAKTVTPWELQGIDKDHMTEAMLAMLAAQVGPKAVANGDLETTIQPDGGALVRFRVVAMPPRDFMKLLHSLFQKGFEQGVMDGSQAVAEAVNKSGGNIEIQGVKKGPASDPTVEITR